MAESNSPTVSPRQTSPKGTVRRKVVRKDRSAAAAGVRSNPGVMKIYTDDSPGLKVDPVVVLVFSLAFIASVFLLHIIGKYTK